MSGYQLIRLDGGGRVPLPEGETVLGRGPLLGVTDKRVSRQHGLLENHNGLLRLKPVHVNPCFSLQGGNFDHPQPLERDCWHTLSHGGLFSLMPGKFIYRVEALGGEHLTPRNSQALEEAEKALSDPPEHIDTAPHVVGQKQTPPLTSSTPPPSLLVNHGASLTRSAHSPECGASPTQEASTTQEASPTQKASSTQEATPTRGPSLKLQQDEEQSGQGFLPNSKRVLPLWMTAAQEGAGRKQAVPATYKTKQGRANLPRSGLSSELPRASLSSELPRASLSSELPRAGLSSELPRAGLSSELPRAGLSSEETRGGLSSEEDDVEEEMSGQAPRRKRRKMRGDANTPSKTPKALSPRNRSNSPEEAGRLSDDGASGSAFRPDKKSKAPGGAGSESGHTPSQSTRPRCPYGEVCYRKNPLHFQECSHPGDHDYQQEEEEPEHEVDRPECPYGTDCYRQNPLHRKEYNHSKRTARTAPRAHVGDDEDEYEDSFINDSSEQTEANDDSDYVPVGSDDSGQEDLHNLQADAKDFLKRRN
ncbi:hypothetical protein NHX12_018722 [Muraenolepis orangiensis]|uniref:Aprataxin and PNK-like factor n=1 Tax=Muraenolepis orangiensis TaxID=630683 RepID=A0A9Q0EXU3_9TELE|nr:hypothetical protein NHX12_018722 [Muraenolepis orangiensis]